ncbi:MAG: hypothetical protein KC657_28380 [Myxococcales bacterium]|nr:hypothetical protein [Myxococcales bacterium]
MEAAVLDEKRSKLARGAFYIAAGVGLLVSLFFKDSLPPDVPGMLALASTTVGFLAPVLPKRRKFRKAQLEITPGRVRVRRKKALRPFDVKARDVVGATTALTPEGELTVVLSLKGRPYAPVILRVANEKEATEVRRALGLGHDGTGAVGFEVRASQGRIAGSWLNALGALGTVLIALAAFDVVGGGAIALGVMAMMAALFVGLPVFLGGGVGDAVALQADGVHILGTSHHAQAGMGGTRYRMVAWSSIKSVLREGDVLDLLLVSGEVVRIVPKSWYGPTKETADALALTLEDAVRRANGLAPQKELTAEALDTLRRAQHERRGDWLARLDAVGRTLTVGAGYRGSAFDEADLWRVVEDPDADADLRIAAARALSVARREESTKTRIDAAVAAAARDGYLEQRFRIALDTPDVERAGAQLDELEAAREGAAVRRAVGLMR